MSKQVLKFYKWNTLKAMYAEVFLENLCTFYVLFIFVFPSFFILHFSPSSPFLVIFSYHLVISLPSTSNADSSSSSCTSHQPEPHTTTMWLEVATTVVAVVVATLVSLRIWYRTTSGSCTSKKSMVGKTVIITGATAGMYRH